MQEISHKRSQSSTTDGYGYSNRSERYNKSVEYNNNINDGRANNSNESYYQNVSPYRRADDVKL